MNQSIPPKRCNAKLEVFVEPKADLVTGVITSTSRKHQCLLDSGHSNYHVTQLPEDNDKFRFF